MYGYTITHVDQTGRSIMLRWRGIFTNPAAAKRAQVGEEYESIMSIDGVAPIDIAGLEDRTVRRRALFYSEELSGPDGMHYFLLREQHHTDADVKAAKSDLRSRFDVTGITVLREHRLAPAKAAAS